MKINSKVPTEVIPVVFDYSEITQTIDSIASIGIAVITGTDASSALMLVGSPVITGTSVVQLVRNGVVGVKYRLFCLATVNSEKYQIDGDMSCIAWHTL